MQQLRLDAKRRRLGRYELLTELARGGMGVVHLARQVEPRVLERPVVVKRLLSSLAASDDIARAFLDEARLLTNVRHPNVVPMLDVVESDGEAFLVLEYVDAVSLAALSEAAREASEPIPLGVASRILSDVLAGLHAAHEARDLRGKPLELVHRDVSPQNVLVGADGVSRLIDFGVAKAAERAQSTTGSGLKGKLGYLAPEQLQGLAIDRRVDVFASGILLHELVSGQRLFRGDDQATVLMRVLLEEIPSLSKLRSDVPAALDEVAARALSRDREERFQTAADLLEALTRAAPPATTLEVARFVERLCAKRLDAMRGTLRELADTPAPLPVERKRSRVPLVAGVAALAGVAVTVIVLVKLPSATTTATANTTATATPLPLPPPTPSASSTSTSTSTTIASAAATATSTPIATPTARRHPIASASASAPAPPASSTPLHANPYATMAPRP